MAQLSRWYVSSRCADRLLPRLRSTLPLHRALGTALPVDDGAGQWRLRGAHDVGGLLLEGPLDLSSKAPPAFWERRTHALLVTLVAGRNMRTDELRRGIEELDERRYAAWGYYDKWAASIATIALERGLLTEDELDDALGRDKAAAAVRFGVGDVVRVRPDEPGVTRWRRPHLRVPGYVFGAVGVVERHVGEYADPEFLAFRGSAPSQPLYRVRFTQPALGWRDEAADGAAPSAVEVEVYGSWLQPATQAELDAADAATDALPSRHTAADCDQRHEHGHGHHGGEARGHEHGSRYAVEARAAAASASEAPGERLSDALVAVLTRNGTVDAAALHAAVCKVDELAAPGFASGAAALGPRLVAKAWTDASFRAAPRSCSVPDMAGAAPRRASRARYAHGRGRDQRHSADQADRRGQRRDDAQPRRVHAARPPAATAHLGGGAAPSLPAPPLAASGSARLSTRHSRRQPLVVRAAARVPRLTRGRRRRVPRSPPFPLTPSLTLPCLPPRSCSCYPLSLLGLSPAWYKDTRFRARAVRAPRALLAEFGTALPAATAVRVHDSTADCRYLVLPRRPEGTHGWGEAELAALVTRDAMIGVALCSVPE